MHRVRITPFAAAALVALAAAILSVLPTALTPGFPQNHEQLGTFWRITSQAELFRAGDYLPVWDPRDNAGFGSPSPALYHRLFLWPAVALTLALGSCKAAVLITLAIFLTIGGLGMYVLTGALGANRFGRLAASAILPFANYTVTDWLVRSAFAEVSALLLMPWVLLWFVRLAADGKVRWWIGPLLGVLYFAHSPVAYVVTAILLVSTLVCLAPKAARLATTGNVRNLAIAVAVFAAPVLPQAFVSLRASASVNVDYLRTGFPPLSFARDVRDYFWDPGYTWDNHDLPMTVQLDSFVLLGLTVAIAMLAVRRQCPRHKAEILVLAVPVVVSMMLQLRPLMGVFEVVPGFAFLQFSWRLLALVTPAIVGIAFGTAGSLTHFKGWLANGIAVGMTLGTIATSGVFRNHDPEMISTAEANALSPPDLILYNEYIPKMQGLDATAARAVMIGWRDSGTAPCAFATTGRNARQELTYRIDCPTATSLRLPIFAAGVQTIRLPHDTALLAENPAEPRLGLRVAAGVTPIAIASPTFIDILLTGPPTDMTRRTIVEN